jgi:hypothetical protein
MTPSTPTGYRELQSPSVYRPWQQPLFGSSAPRNTARPLRVVVWTDDAPAVGSHLNFDVIRHDGTTVESIAEVTWVAPQPAEQPARFRLGLAVFAQTEPNQEELERLLAHDD